MVGHLRQNYKKYFVVLILLALVYPVYNSPLGRTTTTEPTLGLAEPNSQWSIIKSFDGYQTNIDPTKVSDGANPQGQNTSINEGDRVSIRNKGLQILPSSATASTTEQAIKSLHTFRKRSGENILIRTRGTIMEYFEESNDEWITFRTGLTSGKIFDFADYNINTDLKSLTYFGNAFDDAARWNGAHSPLATAIASGDSTITVDDSTSFDSTGSVFYCGNSVAYSAVDDDTGIFTLSASTTATCALDKGITQAVTEYSAHPKGNIYLAANNRLFIAGISSTSQAVYFSAYGDATDFVGASLVVDGTDASPGIFNIGVGGGAVTGLALDENSIYIFKRSNIWKASLTDTVYTLTELKAYDDKSQSFGAISDRGLFSSGNAIFFATGDNQLMNLARVEGIDYPQTTPISKIIQKTVNDLNLDELVGATFRNEAYFALKSNTTVGQNNSVFIYDVKDGHWDSPIVGWNVSDFAIYNNGTTEDLYIADSISPNVFKVIDSAIDDVYDVKANWRSKQFDFDTPQSLKQMTNIFVEGYITPNTDLTISLLLDEEGYAQVFTTEFKGSETDYIFNSTEYNVFGFTSFGTDRFGSNDDQSGKRKFRIYLGKEFRPDPFYTAQLEFASDQENADWEVLSFGMKVREYSDPEKRELFRSFK